MNPTDNRRIAEEIIEAKRDRLDNHGYCLSDRKIEGVKRILAPEFAQALTEAEQRGREAGIRESLEAADCRKNHVNGYGSNTDGSCGCYELFVEALTNLLPDSRDNGK